MTSFTKLESFDIDYRMRKKDMQQKKKHQKQARKKELLKRHEEMKKYTNWYGFLYPTRKFL